MRFRARARVNNAMSSRVMKKNHDWKNNRALAGAAIQLSLVQEARDLRDVEANGEELLK